jgi:hypothetical protein
MWEKKKTFLFLQTSQATMEISVEISQKLKVEFLYGPAICFSVYSQKNPHLLTRVPIFIVVLFTIAKLWMSLGGHQGMNA